MKILITGIHGFVGYNLVEYLKSENEMYGLDMKLMSNFQCNKLFGFGDYYN